MLPEEEEARRSPTTSASEITSPGSNWPPAFPPAPPSPPSLPNPRSVPSHGFRPGVIWYLLALAFLLMSAFAYLMRPRQVGPQSAQAVSQPILPRTEALPSVHDGSSVPSKIDESRNREDEFRQLINTHLSISPTQPNVGILIEPSKPEPGGSIADSLFGFLTSTTKIRFIANLADTRALTAGGFFDDLYAGNGQFLTQAFRLSRLDYLLLGKAVYSFRRQPTLDPELITSDLTLTCRLVDRTGTVTQSVSFSSTGAGYTETQALERATENAATQLKERIIDSIR